MYKSYKFRIYLNDTQRELINKSFECYRFVYNHYFFEIKSNGYQDTYSNTSNYTKVSGKV